MHLLTTLEREPLEGIAASMGLQLYDYAYSVGMRGQFKGRHRHKFTLRPQHGSSRDARYRLVRDNPYSAGGSGERRIWAVCWHGHRDFMRAVFELDSDATFRTAVDTWDGSEDFEQRHTFSGYRNIGSQMYPQSYSDACRC